MLEKVWVKYKQYNPTNTWYTLLVDDTIQKIDINLVSKKLLILCLFLSIINLDLNSIIIFNLMVSITFTFYEYNCISPTSYDPKQDFDNTLGKLLITTFLV